MMHQSPSSLLSTQQSLVASSAHMDEQSMFVHSRLFNNLVGCFLGNRDVAATLMVLPSAQKCCRVWLHRRVSVEAGAVHHPQDAGLHCTHSLLACRLRKTQGRLLLGGDEGGARSRGRGRVTRHESRRSKVVLRAPCAMAHGGWRCSRPPPRLVALSARGTVTAAELQRSARVMTRII
jgi:hypothetical protein